METTTKTLQTLTTTEVADKQTVRPKVRIYKFTGKENHLYSVVEASLVTKNYRQNAGRLAVRGGFFARNIFEKILTQDGCVGIRNYFACNNDGTPALVLVAADGNGNDMIHGWIGADMLPLSSNSNILNSDLEDHLVPDRKKSNVFTGEENHSITIAEAKNFVQNYRKDKDADAMKGGFFSRDIYERILDQEGCVGIDCYFAEKEGGRPTVVLVGVDSKGNDLVHGIVGQVIVPCPPFCGGGDSAL